MKTLLKSLAVLICLVVYPVAQASECIGPMPWKTLRFEQKKLWLTARSELLLQDYCGAEASRRLDGLSNSASAVRALRVLSATSSVGDNFETTELFLQPETLQLYYRQRQSQGKNRRWKDYRYNETSIQRTRKDPSAGESELPPRQWSRVRQQTRHLKGDLATASPLTSSHALLLLAGDPALRSPGASRTIFVHTDHNVYRVSLQNDAVQEQDSRALLDGRALAPTARQAHRIRVIASPVGQLPDKPDFELMGLSGDIVILVDQDTGLPLQISGQAPRIGAATIKLVAAEL